MPDTSIEATIAGHPFALCRRDVERAMRQVDPDPIASHFVVIVGRRYPPKQVISCITGVDRADFTTHQARRTLKRLGFSAGRRAAGSSGQARAVGSEPTPLADVLRPLVGQWVAIKDDEVLHSAGDPQDLVSWLSRHDQHADSMFRVPEDDRAASGLAPL
jgi:hypothetical protein